MAWQLIYTSAPRSLDAGRSGFGTVARHRAITPLLTSTIERISQFSRLPGADARRVIFCYRILSVAGNRFHVLSSIRDAGADYTGRTNHLAHHLIAEPKEIAQLGKDGPSPADVLLGMNWLTSWNEPPRFLEDNEEVFLAAIPPPTNGSAWRRITGNPDQAWLLASGEASRGAYIIAPTGCDLREVFAESLRLMPERCWKIPFTTSLQPSDEPADFRWVGVEEDSSLRAKCESFGRSPLNLADPSTLPLVEVTHAPAESPVAKSYDSLPSSTPETISPVEPLVIPPESTIRTPAPFEPEARALPLLSALLRYRKWGIIAATLVLILSLVFGFLTHMTNWWRVRSDLAESLHRSGYLPRGRSVSLADDWQVATMKDVEVSSMQEKVGAFNRLNERLHGASLSSLASNEVQRDLATIKAEPPWEGLCNQINHILSLRALHVGKVRDAAEIADAVRKQRESFMAIYPQSSSVDWQRKLVAEFQSEMDEIEAEELNKMFDPQLPPPERMENFKAVVKDFAAQCQNPRAKRMIQELQEKLHEPIKQASIQNTELLKALPTPAKIEKPPEKHGPTDKADSGRPQGSPQPAIAGLSNVPLYFVRTKDVKEGTVLSIPQIGSQISFVLAPSIAGPVKPYASFAPKPSQFGDYGEGLSVANGIITFGKNAPTGEFVLKGYDSQGKSALFVLWAIVEGQTLAMAELGVTREGDFLVIAGLQRLPAMPALRVQLPPTFARGESALLKHRLNGDHLDLKPFIDHLKEKIQLLEEGLEKPAIPESDAQMLPARSEAVIKPHLSEQASKNIIETNPAKRAGQYLQAIGTDWPDWISENVVVTADSLFKPGVALTQAGDDKLAAALTAAKDCVQAAKQDFNSASGKASKTRKRSPGDGSPKKANVPVIGILDAMKEILESVNANTPQEKEKRAKEIARVRKTNEKTLDDLKIDPLLHGKLPAGAYKLLGNTANDESEVLLIDLYPK